VVEVRKKKGESFDSMYRRFIKRMQQSGKVLEAKERKFLKPKASGTAKKNSALVGLKYRAKREYQRRIGKIEDEPRRRW